MKTNNGSRNRQTGVQREYDLFVLPLLFTYKTRHLIASREYGSRKPLCTTLLRLLFYTSGFSINLYRISTPVLPIRFKWFAYIDLHSGVEKNRTPVLLPYSRKMGALSNTMQHLGPGICTTKLASASHWFTKRVQTNYSEIHLNLDQLPLEQLCYHPATDGLEIRCSIETLGEG